MKQKQQEKTAFVHAVNILSTYDVSGTVLCTGDKTMNKKTKISDLMKLTY